MQYQAAGGPVGADAVREIIADRGNVYTNTRVTSVSGIWRLLPMEQRTTPPLRMPSVPSTSIVLGTMRTLSLELSSLLGRAEVAMIDFYCIVTTLAPC